MRTAKQLSILFFISVLIGTPKTIAISYFDNTSGIEKYNPLSKGLADMLITDLSNIESIQIVEREKLESLLKEIELGDSKFIDPNTAQSLGKGLGADYILTGAFLSIDPMMRIDSRIMEVSTGKIIGAEEVTGQGDDFFSLEKKLALLLIERLELDTDLEENTSEIDLDAVLDYSEAIDLDDKGFKEEASEKLKKLASEFPDFKDVASKLDEIRIWMDQLREERSRMLDEMIESKLSGLDTSSAEYLNELYQLSMPLMADMSKYGLLLDVALKMKSLGKKRLNVSIGGGSPVTIGEMALYYEILVVNGYKNYDEVVKLGQEFILQYPTSLYFASIEIMISQALNTIENKKKSKEKIENQLPLYIKQMNIAEIYNLMGANEYDQWPKNENLYDLIKSHAEKTIIPILDKDWSLYFSTDARCFRYLLGPGLSKYDLNPKAMFLITFRRFALANEDENMAGIIDRALTDYEESLYIKENDNQIENFYSEIEKMERYSNPAKSDRIYREENTFEDLKAIKLSEKYRDEEHRIRDLLSVYGNIFKILAINNDFESYEGALNQYKDDSLLKERKKHRREFFKLSKEFKEQKEKFDKKMEYFTNYEKISQLLLFEHLYKREAFFAPDIVSGICLDLMKYELGPKDKLDVYYTLWSCAQNLADHKKATTAYKNLLSLRPEFEKLDDVTHLSNLNLYITSCESMLKFIPQ